MIFQVVDSTISSIQFDFNTIHQKSCMFADFSTVSIMLEVSLQLRVVAMQLLLERNDRYPWNDHVTHMEDMYSNMKETLLEYNDFIGDIVDRAPDTVIVEVASIVNSQVIWSMHACCID